ncbi:helix-turn-helix transcriptional regulator [Nocardioides aquiterrae]|uniref:helix-turn-helix transcriptional regulator n=1 Tax=Nocardioides aquiterrae TaxID=203799 RepID=UPI0031E33AD0
MASVGRWLPADAIWLTLSDPGSTVSATVGSTGLDQSILDYLDRPSVAREIQLAELNQNRPPVTVTELPVPVDELPTWADCLLPAGFREGLGVPLCEPGGPYLGMLSFFFATGEAPSSAVRDHLGEIAPLIALGLSPLRSLRAVARLVAGAVSGVVLLRNGTSHALPGLDEHPLLGPGSPVVDLARQSLVAGQVFRSFLWPEDGDPGTTGHARITVLAATDAPDFVLGTLVVTPGADCQGLSPRELEVLGLLVDGCSNQQISRQLGVALRTVAAHVEHILHKLEVPTRTLAAVRAEREGWHVPPTSRSRYP